MIYGNGAPIVDAFVKDNGVWKRPLEIYGWTPANELVKAWPKQVAPDPLTGVTVSPSQQGWSLVSGQYRASFSATPIGGSGSYSYNWTVSNGGVIVSGQGTPNVTIRNTYNDKRSVATCTVTDLTLGGSVSGSGNAGTNAPTLYADVTPSTRNWSGSPGSFSTTFSVTATGGTGSYDYSWSADGGATIVSGQGTANVTVSGSSQGAASNVSCTVTSGSQAASDTSTVSASSVAPLAVSVTPSSQNWSGNAGSYSASANASASGGSGSYGYSWSVSGGTIQSGQGTANISFTSNTGAAATATCTVTDTVLGGTKSAASSVAAKPLSASLSRTSLTGSGTGAPVQSTDTVTINVSGGSGSYSYVWNNDGQGTGGVTVTDDRAKTVYARTFSDHPQGTTRTGGMFATVTDNVTGEVTYTNVVNISLTRNYNTMTVSVSPTSLSGSSTSSPVQTSGSAVVSVSGGSGNFSYNWIYANTGTGGINPVSNSANTRFISGSMNAGQTYSAGFFCRVTDNVTGATADTAVVTSTLTCNYATLTASASPGSLSGIGNSGTIVTSGSATCNTSGGSGNFTYNWEWDQGAASGSIVPTNTNSQSTTFQSGDNQAPGNTRGAGFRCRVTDNVTGAVVITNSVGVNLTRYATLAASASPSNLSGSGEGQPLFTSGAATANASGGSGNYSYQWIATNSGGVEASNAGGQTTYFATTIQPQGSEWTGTYFCRVTDTVTGATTDTNSVTATLKRTAAEVFFVEVQGDSFWSQTGAFTGNANVGAAVTGGRAPLSYNWASEGGVGITFSPNGLSTTTVGTTNRGQTGSIKVTVTDADNRTTVSSIWLIEPAG